MTKAFLEGKRLESYVNLSFHENWYKSYARSGMFCGSVGVKESPIFKTLISSLLSGALDKFDTFVEIGSTVCDVGPDSSFACICC